MRLLIVDNHDSFSAILRHYLWELTGIRPLFYRNDALSRAELRALDFDAAVLSPGPGNPGNARDFGIGRDLLELYPRLPVLGVCLGHQGLAHYAGARIIPLAGARHGRPSVIRHDGEGLFRGLPQGFSAIRYHSLAVDADSLPASVQVTAWSGEDRQVMGIRFTDRPWFGVQFHPESVGTEHGKALLANFLEIAKPGLNAGGLHRIPMITDSRPEPGETLNHRELAWREPEAVFSRHFSAASTAFWLDGSSQGNGWETTCMGRADSTLAFDDREAFRAWYAACDLEASRQAPWPGYRGGPVGYFTYEGPGRWMVPEGYLVFHHTKRRVFAAWEKPELPVWLKDVMASWEEVDAASMPESFLPPFSKWTPSLPREDYLDRIGSLQASIAAGDTYEACLTHAFRAESGADPLSVFLRLRRRNPAPYAAYLAFPDLRVVSVSPELFLELSPRGMLRSRPIKGTRPRGKTPERDAALRGELATSVKDQAENRMIVDLTRHDFSRVCALGSVEVAALLEVETHPALFQLISEVRGRLEPSRHALEAVEACFPGGSMTGAPKERTMELLSALEAEPRGVFSGALGYFTRGGAFTLSMVIRTLENRGNSWRIGCGGAILADSDPAAEWEEASLKARSVIDAASM